MMQATSDAVEAGLELLRSGRCKTVVQAARNAGCARSTLNERWKAERDSLRAPVRELVVDGELASSWTPDTLLREHGLDPDEWIIVRIRVNRWDDPDNPKHQLRFDVTPKSALIEFPDPGKWKAPPRPKAAKKDAVRKVVIVSDHHAPFEDRGLHACFLQYLRDEKPAEGIINGDLLDFHTISRHRSREGFAAPVNECLQAGFNILADYREASPDTRWILKKGNHDQRLEDGVVDNLRGLHRITAAGDGVPALSLRRLLRLDELRIDYVDADWDMAKVRISQKLSVRHGPATGKAATQRLLDKFSVSIIQGHTHRLSVTMRTEHSDLDDDPVVTRLAAEGGCMCQVAEGLGYADSPDWQNGFIEATVWPDGDFHCRTGVYVGGRLFAPSGKRYRA